MEIQNAIKDDLSKILDVQKAAYSTQVPIYGDYPFAAMSETIDDLYGLFGKEVFFKVVDNGRIVGTARAREHHKDCYISRMAISPEYQGRGLGKELMRGIEEYFYGVHRYWLITGAKSERNIAFYTKLGYRQYDKRKMTPKIDIVFMEKFNKCE